MRIYNQSWQMFLAVCLLVVCVGCPSRRDAENTEETTEQSAVVESEPMVPETIEEPAKSKEPDEPARPEIPKVRLTEAHSVTCLVQVGDVMPKAELPAVGGGGSVMPIDELYGEKLTVILFWNSNSIYATAELEDLTGDVAIPFAQQGVRVIGINEGDSPEEAARQVDSLAAKFANFLDPGGTFFVKVATEKIPRTYLLDAAGKILWFDIEYSATTRRDLQQAIKVALGEM